MANTPALANLLPPSWKTKVSEWLAEDTPSFDYGGYIVGEAPREAFLLGKGSQAAVLAGVPFFTEVFEQLGCKLVAVKHLGRLELTDDCAHAESNGI